jgi:ADP-heptose:LPS heptosyltransferase
LKSAIGNRILVYRIGSLGDTIVALPAFCAVRENFPNAFVALLNNAHEDSKRVMAQSVLPSEGLFDAWLTYPTGFSGTASLKERLKLLFELRSYKFDTLVYLAPRLRTRKQVKRDLFFFRLAGIQNFLGHHGLPSPLPQKENEKPLPLIEHEADHLLYRLSLSGLKTRASGEGSMDLRLSESELSKAQHWLEENCGEALDQNRLVAIAPGSKWQSKVWPEINFEKLGERLIREFNLFPVIFGGSEDRAGGERLIAKWKRGANAAGALNVRESAAALSYCRLLVGNDTGTMHLAAAVKTSCVVAFAAQDWPGRWYPYGKGHIVLREAVQCEGCMLKVCDKENLCLTLIDVDRVFEACRQSLV